MNSTELPVASNQSPAETGPVGPPLAPRRFTLGDAMIVVGYAACLSAWLARSAAIPRIVMYVREAPRIVRYLWFEGPPPTIAPAGSPILWPMHLKVYLWQTPLAIFSETFIPAMQFATPAVLLFRLRRPRPPWRTIARQPGALACLVVAGMVLLEMDLRWLFTPIPTHPLTDIGAAVAVSWLALKLSGRWSPERGWIDRLGRAVGASWIVIAVFMVAVWGA